MSQIVIFILLADVSQDHPENNICPVYTKNLTGPTCQSRFYSILKALSWFPVQSVIYTSKKEGVRGWRETQNPKRFVFWEIHWSKVYLHIGEVPVYVCNAQQNVHMTNVSWKDYRGAVNYYFLLILKHLDYCQCSDAVCKCNGAKMKWTSV